MLEWTQQSQVRCLDAGRGAQHSQPRRTPLAALWNVVEGGGTWRHSVAAAGSDTLDGAHVNTYSQDSIKHGVLVLTVSPVDEGGG